MGLTFIRPVDIANRALDHVGGTAIDETLAFSEQSRNAVICARVYDKLRQAELRRNEWDFAVKKAVLRALDTNTVLLQPSLWVSTATYFVGSIVTDAAGQLWVSLIPSNVGFEPGTLPAGWAPYYGPMSVSLYDSTTSYFAGELVYILGAGNDAFTKILLHFDGADASTAFVDSNLGGSPHTWTASGNAQIDTAIVKFG